MVFNVMAVSDSERAKANLDPDYSPKEHKVGWVKAPSESQANRLLRKGIAEAGFPADACLCLIED